MPAAFKSLGRSESVAAFRVWMNPSQQWLPRSMAYVESVCYPTAISRSVDDLVVVYKSRSCSDSTASLKSVWGL